MLCTKLTLNYSHNYLTVIQNIINFQNGLTIKKLVWIGFNHYNIITGIFNYDMLPCKVSSRSDNFSSFLHCGSIYFSRILRITYSGKGYLMPLIHYYINRKYEAFINTCRNGYFVSYKGIS